MKIIELQPLREWSEKDGDKLTGRIRIYVGKLHIGTCKPVKNFGDNIERYHFLSMYDMLTGEMTSHAMTMDEIKTNIECTLKEVATKFIKSFRTLKPATK